MTTSANIGDRRRRTGFTSPDAAGAAPAGGASMLEASWGFGDSHALSFHEGLLPTRGCSCRDVVDNFIRNLDQTPPWSTLRIQGVGNFDTLYDPPRA